jgi:hypothetical protein
MLFMEARAEEALSRQLVQRTVDGVWVGSMGFRDNILAGTLDETVPGRE